MPSFSIRKSFLLPLGLLLLLSLALFAVCLIQGQPLAKVVILGFIILPVLALFVESASRKVAVGEAEFTVFRFLRSKTMRFAEITSVDTVRVSKRAFVTLSAGDDFVILSNAYDQFPAMIRSLLAGVSPEVVSAETRELMEAPPKKSSDIVSCWAAVILMALIIYMQFAGKH